MRHRGAAVETARKSRRARLARDLQVSAPGVRDFGRRAERLFDHSSSRQGAQGDGKGICSRSIETGIGLWRTYGSARRRSGMRGSRI